MELGIQLQTDRIDCRAVIFKLSGASSNVLAKNCFWIWITWKTQVETVYQITPANITLYKVDKV